MCLSLPEETSAPADCTHSLNTSGTGGTSFPLQQHEQNVSRRSAGPASVWIQTGTSLAECEAGVVIATVSLFGAAGGVVLTAVAPDR